MTLIHLPLESNKWFLQQVRALGVGYLHAWDPRAVDHFLAMQRLGFMSYWVTQ